MPAPAPTDAVAVRAAAELELRRRQRILYQRDPVAFTHDRLGVRLTDQQAAICESVRDEPRTVVAAANSVGKTFVASVVVPWFIECFEDSIAVTTAPTFRQVQNLLWKEIRVRHRNASPPLRGEVLKTPRWDVSAAHFAIGQTSDDEDGFKGHHAEHLLVAFDEAAGVAKPIWDAAASMLKGPGARFLGIGNPTVTSGPFFDAFHDKSAINATHRLSAAEHPNVTAALAHLGVTWDDFVAAPARTLTLPADWRDPFPGAVSLVDLDLMKVELGVGTPLWNVQVLGQFPEQGSNALISLEWLDRARRADTAELLPGTWAGLDVARFGADRSALVRVVDGRVVAVDTWQGHELSHTAGKAAQAIRDGYTVNVDGAGMGAGVVSHLAEQGFTEGRDFHEVQVGEAAPTKDRYPKLRDEVWGNAARLLRDGAVDLSQVAEGDWRLLRAELTAVLYAVDSGGRVKVEGKDDLRKRIGRSPDLADAFNLAVWRPKVRTPIWAM